MSSTEGNTPLGRVKKRARDRDRDTGVKNGKYTPAELRARCEARNEFARDAKQMLRLLGKEAA